jgi:circadian clock protein KaiC
MNTEESSIKRCPTGINELDELLKGGFPAGSLILIAGHPGSGKTMFAAKFIYEGIKRYGEPGVYLSLAEGRKDFFRYMAQLGMDFEELEKKGLFRYVDLPFVTDTDAVIHIFETLIDKVLELRTIIKEGMKVLIVSWLIHQNQSSRA